MLNRFVINLFLISCSLLLYSKESTFSAHIKPNTYLSEYPIFSDKRLFGLYHGIFTENIEYARKKSNKKLKSVLLIGNQQNLSNLSNFNINLPYNIYIETLHCNMNISIITLITRKYFSTSIIDYVPKYQKENSFLISSDNNTKIKIYGNSPYGFFDYSQYWTSHPHTIAILIDENNYITHILDKVSSKKDILKFL